MSARFLFAFVSPHGSLKTLDSALGVYPFCESLLFPTSFSSEVFTLTVNLFRLAGPLFPNVVSQPLQRVRKLTSCIEHFVFTYTNTMFVSKPRKVSLTLFCYLALVLAIATVAQADTTNHNVVRDHVVLNRMIRKRVDSGTNGAAAAPPDLGTGTSSSSSVDASSTLASSSAAGTASSSATSSIATSSSASQASASVSQTDLNYSDECTLNT